MSRCDIPYDLPPAAILAATATPTAATSLILPNRLGRRVKRVEARVNGGTVANVVVCMMKAGELPTIATARIHMLAGCVGAATAGGVCEPAVSHPDIMLEDGEVYWIWANAQTDTTYSDLTTVSGNATVYVKVFVEVDEI